MSLPFFSNNAIHMHTSCNRFFVCLFLLTTTSLPNISGARRTNRFTFLAFSAKSVFKIVYRIKPFVYRTGFRRYIYRQQRFHNIIYACVPDYKSTVFGLLERPPLNGLKISLFDNCISHCGTFHLTNEHISEQNRHDTITTYTLA